MADSASTTSEPDIIIEDCGKTTAIIKAADWRPPVPEYKQDERDKRHFRRDDKKFHEEMSAMEGGVKKKALRVQANKPPRPSRQKSYKDLKTVDSSSSSISNTDSSQASPLKQDHRLHSTLADMSISASASNHASTPTVAEALEVAINRSWYLWKQHYLKLKNLERNIYRELSDYVTEKDAQVANRTNETKYEPSQDKKLLKRMEMRIRVCAETIRCGQRYYWEYDDFTKTDDYDVHKYPEAFKMKTEVLVTVRKEMNSRKTLLKDLRKELADAKAKSKGKGKDKSTDADADADTEVEIAADDYDVTDVLQFDPRTQWSAMDYKNDLFPPRDIEEGKK